MSENRFIILLRTTIEQSLGWGASAHWADSDFENLSEKIFEKTQVRLSVSTLKRIWGKVRYESSPSVSTLNVLAKFSGYESWRVFQQRHSDAKAVEAVTEDYEDEQENVPFLKSRTARALAFVVIGMICLSAFLIMKGKGKQAPPRGTIPVKFEMKKLSDDLPNSVVFNYDVSGFQPQEVYIQQSWDPARRQKVSPAGKQHTSIYYHPGYFLAKLIVDNTIVKEDVVFIKTKGWKGIIDLKPVPVYLSNDEVKQQGSMGISTSLLKDKINSSIFNDTWVKFSNVREFEGLKSDDFELEASVKNTSTLEQCICRKVNILVLGKNGAIIVPLGVKGCSASLNMLTPNVYLDGTKNDLSGLGCDFKDFEQIRIGMKDHHLKIALNNKLVFDMFQRTDISDIVGLRFEFEGAGEIKDIKLSKGGLAVYTF